MRSVLSLLFCLGSVGGCTGWVPPTGALAGADLASIAVFGRGFVDMGVSAVSGRDCSVVRLDRGDTYCAPPEGPGPKQPYCTRSLGAVDCWTDPALLPARQAEVGYTPAPTAEQLRYRSARWPKALTAF